MATDDRNNQTERRLIEVPNGVLEVIRGPAPASAVIVCAAHPAGVFAESTVNLLRETAGTGVVCINPRGIGQSSPAPRGGAGYTLDSMIDDFDEARPRVVADAARLFLLGCAS